MSEWDPDDMAAHLEFLRALNQELIDSGELVEMRALTGPELAKIVTHDGQGPPVVTDGPFPEVKELLAGYHPMVELNRAVAAAMVHGPRAGLDLLEPLDKRLPGHYRLDAVRGHLHDLLGDTEAAAAHYRAAAARTTSEPERQYLITRVARLRKQPRREAT